MAAPRRPIDLPLTCRRCGQRMRATVLVDGRVRRMQCADCYRLVAALSAAVTTEKRSGAWRRPAGGAA